MIKWIIDNLGTASFNDVSDKSNYCIIDVRDLVDKEGNSVETVKNKIIDGVANLSQSKKVIICCDYGMSRSNAIAAGILAAWSNTSIDEAVKKVIAVTNERSIRIEVISVVGRALDEINSKPIQNVNKNEKRILITGGSDFIGNAAFGKLKGLYNVFTPGYDEINLLRGSAELDLYVKEFCITHILHLASPRVINTNIAMGESLTMLKSVIDVCEENNTKLLYLSGWVVYSGYRSQLFSASENTPLFPKGTYDEAKFLCETLLHHHLMLNKICCTIIRSSLIYGPGSDKPKFIYNFLDKALQNEDIITHKYINGYPYLDLLYIDDLVDLISKIINDNSSGCFNVGSGIGISTKEIAEMIVKITKSDSIIRHSNIESYTSNIVMDYSLVNKLFNWQPKVDIHSGLQKVIQATELNKR